MARIVGDDAGSVGDPIALAHQHRQGFQIALDFAGRRQQVSLAAGEACPVIDDGLVDFGPVAKGVQHHPGRLGIADRAFGRKGISRVAAVSKQQNGLAAGGERRHQIYGRVGRLVEDRGTPAGRQPADGRGQGHRVVGKRLDLGHFVREGQQGHLVLLGQAVGKLAQRSLHHDQLFAGHRQVHGQHQGQRLAAVAVEHYVVGRYGLSVFEQGEVGRGQSHQRQAVSAGDRQVGAHRGERLAVDVGNDHHRFRSLGVSPRQRRRSQSQARQQCQQPGQQSAGAGGIQTGHRRSFRNAHSRRSRSSWL